MAGFYADVPAPRMAYDRDGTVLVQVYAGAATTLAQSSIENINSESDSAIYSTYANDIPPRQFVLIFPQQRNIAAFFSAVRASWTSCQIQTSPDTTNGIDGTWTTQTSVPDRTSVSIVHRTAVTTVNWTNVKGLKIGWFSTSGNAQRADFYALHLFGRATDISSLDMLRPWHPTLDEPLDDLNSADGAYLDWGDVARGTTQDRTFRIKNNSATYSANDIVVTAQALTNTTPSVPAQMTFSTGGAFSTSLNIGALAPGALSSMITIRRTTPTNAVLSLWTVRVVADPGSWS